MSKLYPGHKYTDHREMGIIVRHPGFSVIGEESYMFLAKICVMVTSDMVPVWTDKFFRSITSGALSDYDVFVT